MDFQDLPVPLTNKYFQIILLILVSLTWAAGAALIISAGVSDNQFIDALGIIINSIFSIFLVYIYFGMRNLQNDQTQIQNNQLRWMEADHEPAIAICSLKRQERGKILVRISNLGKGIAQNIQIRTSIDVESDQFQGLTGSFDLVLVDDEVDRQGSLLQPGEECLEFRGSVVVRAYDYKESAEIDYGIDSFLSELWGKDTKISIDIDLYYENIVGEEEWEDIFDSSSRQVVDGMAFEEIEEDPEFIF